MPRPSAHLPTAQQTVLTGRGFFPGLISAPFRAGLHAALDFAIVASLLAAAASWLRGGRYVYSEPDDRHRPGRGGRRTRTVDTAQVPLPVGATDDVSGASIAQVEAG